MLNTLRLGGLSWSLMNVYIIRYISIHTNSFPEYICMGHQHCAWLVVLSEVVWIPTARSHCCQLTCTQLQLHTHHVYDNIRFTMQYQLYVFTNTSWHTLNYNDIYNVFLDTKQAYQLLSHISLFLWSLDGWLLKLNLFVQEYFCRLNDIVRSLMTLGWYCEVLLCST